MKRLIAAVEDVLWPRGVKCLCCDAYSSGNALCPVCTRGLEAMRLPVKDSARTSLSTYCYDGVTRELIHLLKYECTADAAAVLAKGMAVTLSCMQLPLDTVLTWVTMPESRRRTRGIDHGRTLCEALSEITGLPARRMLTRVGRPHTQRGLDKETRLRNVRDTFRCDRPPGRSVLIVDDVMTTGATAAACEAVLREAGAEQVFVLTAARVMTDPGELFMEEQKG